LSLRACHLGVLQWQNKFVLHQRQRFPCKYVEELGVPSVAIFYMVMACNVPSVTELLDMLLILYPLLFCEMETKEQFVFFEKKKSTLSSSTFVKVCFFSPNFKTEQNTS